MLTLEKIDNSVGGVRKKPRNEEKPTDFRFQIFLFYKFPKNLTLTVFTLIKKRKEL